MTTFRQLTTPDLTIRIETTGPGRDSRHHFGDAPSPEARWSDRPVLQEWTDCTVEWTEWSGKLLHPTGSIRLAEGVAVRHYGFRSVELTGGTLDAPLRKKLGTPGFRVMKDGITLIHEQTTLDKQKRIVTP